MLSENSFSAVYLLFNIIKEYVPNNTYCIQSIYSIYSDKSHVIVRIMLNYIINSYKAPYCLFLRQTVFKSLQNFLISNKYLGIC